MITFSNEVEWRMRLAFKPEFSPNMPILFYWTMVQNITFSKPKEYKYGYHSADFRVNEGTMEMSDQMKDPR